MTYYNSSLGTRNASTFRAQRNNGLLTGNLTNTGLVNQSGAVSFPNTIGLVNGLEGISSTCPQNPYQNRFCYDAFGNQNEFCPLVNNCGQPRVYYDGVTGILISPQVQDIAPIDNQGFQDTSVNVNSLNNTISGTAGNNYPYNPLNAYPGIPVNGTSAGNLIL
ncbi:hypothetical protein [Cedratvirus kamchatka]|uniref:Uncharacterized protein n=1 Tax=Cedratvirus kamchatka TaxID=2716914 RepID=A0A6G8MXY2_9VIRU|nr:hypothetical protein [Cedratvirus kamchatka]WIL04077.1 hypothetical protein Clen_147 [Cedratvirus lena]WIL04737.1 hypothetical protein Cduv_257 [Cedratvirus duvanny]